jgi:O-antigen chain-terminating methyltransferase
MEHKIQELNKIERSNKMRIFENERRLARLLNDAKKNFPNLETDEQVNKLIMEEEQLSDSTYASFEDTFRGLREEIKERQKIYLPYIETIHSKIEGFRVLDLGCGRGEFLELLREEGVSAIGIDNNYSMIRQCEELGLEAIYIDSYDYLIKQKKDSYGAVTGFHIVEHLPLKRIVGLFDEVLRVVKPGGMAIFESPNPENLLVSTLYFYKDPTHLVPIVPDTLKFILEDRGFADVEVKRFHPRNEMEKRGEIKYTGNEYVDELIHLANMEMDYAVIGFKK